MLNNFLIIILDLSPVCIDEFSLYFFKQSLSQLSCFFFNFFFSYWLYFRIISRAEFSNNKRFIVKKGDKPKLKYEFSIFNSNGDSNKRFDLLHVFKSIVFTGLLCFCGIFGLLLLYVWCNIFIILIVHFFCDNPTYVFNILWYVFMFLWFYIISTKILK